MLLDFLIIWLEEVKRKCPRLCLNLVKMNRKRGREAGREGRAKKKG